MQSSDILSVYIRSFAVLSLSVVLTVGCSDAETAAPKNPGSSDTTDSTNSDASNCQPGDNTTPGSDSGADNTGTNTDDGTPGTDTDDGNTGTNCEPDTDPGDSGSTDTGNDNTDSNNNSDCDRTGFSTASHQASYATNAFQYEAQNSLGSPRDLLMLSSFQGNFNGPTEPGTYSVEGSNYADCGLCLLALTGCTEGGTCEKYFYADVGSVTITEFGQNGETFAGELNSVVFKEVTIDPDTYVSTPVAGGETWCMNGHSFSLTVGQDPTVPGTGSGDNGNTDTGDTNNDNGNDSGTDNGNGGNDNGSTTPGDGVAVLGNGNHTTAGVTLTVVAGTAQGLNVPRDIAFHPQRPEELWVMNWGDSSGSILFKSNSTAVWMCSQAYYGTYDGCDQGCGVEDPDCENGSQQVYNNCSQGHEPDPSDPTRCYMPGGQNSSSAVFPRYHKRLANSPNDMDYSTNLHFFARPAAIAFGANGNFTSAQEEDGFTQPDTPYDFMGPTMWSSQLNLFNSGHSSHLDMLHNSPNSVGVAWETANVYWIYDGYHGSLTRYNFNQDHGPGGTDHTDGEVYRYADGQLGYEEGVPSHLVYENGTLYAADTANNRIVALNTQSGSIGSNIQPNYDGTVQKMVNNANLSTLISGVNVDGMSKPSGLEIHDNMFFVSDNETSRIFAFNREGQLLDWIDLDLPPDSIMGMAFDNAGMLYVVDAEAEQILQLSPK
ncbi:MAG: hypothetical protein HOK28_12645 [Deltaproteobacteria bacterium]|nr:hypothetical protein [Deltaproteobacteria bacterium]